MWPDNALESEKGMDESTAANGEHGGEALVSPSPLLQRIQAYREWLDRFLIQTAYLSGAFFALTAFFITYDVLARKWGYLLGLPTTRVTDEISGYILVLAGTWGMAYTLRTGGHVRIDVLLPLMRPKLQLLMEVLANALMGFFALVVSWKSWYLVVDSIDTGITSSTYLLTPLYIPQTILALGFSLLTLTSFAMAAFQLMEWGVMLTRGDAAVPLRESIADPTGPA
jgi:TRAP-type C4-dicarboxylate transport system permease small subunit